MRENLGLAMGVVGFLLLFVSVGCGLYARWRQKASHLADVIAGAALLTIITAFILLPPE